MKLINERSQVCEVAAKWEAQYPPGSNKYTAFNTDDIGKRLKKLDTDTATAADVESIIGNNSWVKPPSCDECGKDHPAVVEIGQPPDYESATARICFDCLRAALKLEPFQ